jgi:hypothetical protein
MPLERDHEEDLPHMPSPRPPTPLEFDCEGEISSIPPNPAVTTQPDNYKEYEDEGDDDLDVWGLEVDTESELDDNEDYVDDEMEDVQYTTHRMVSHEQGKLPRALLPSLQFSQDVIEAIKNAKLEDDLDNKQTSQVRNPSSDIEEVNGLGHLSIDIFMAHTNSSQQAYIDTKEAFQHFNPDFLLDSLYNVESRIECLTGVFRIMTDMCPSGCVAYTGPYSGLEACSKCTTP